VWTLVATLAAAGLMMPVSVTAQADAALGAEATNDVLERALESRAKGGEAAGVVVFEIADFQCPYCAQFAARIAPELDALYVEPGRIQWVFVNLPLHNHPRAWHAAEAALCAGVAGDRFWPMHDRLFADQDAWGGAADPAPLFARYAAELGVPADAFRACTVGDQVAALIIQDLGSAVSAGVTGTPTFIVMKDGQVVERIVGLRSVEEWSEILDGALQ
jgi:protein-disulfide isomerase